MKILILDNYDSFTYNLALLVKSLAGKQPDVKRNDRITLEAIADYDKILLSPGPGLPAEAGILTELIEAYAPSKSILGICLGHQAIGQVFGAQLCRMEQVCHGRSGLVYPQEDAALFRGLDTVFEAGRYHSWIVDRKDLPERLSITATDDQGHIMALQHRTFDAAGLQFHPESVLTPCGVQIVANWLEC